MPVDGTASAEHALPFALALARRAGAEVALAHVYSTLQAANEPELLGWHGGSYLVEPCRDYLEALAGRLASASPVRVRPLLLKGYWPEDALCETANWDADLVVMAARPRGWWHRLWHGSVSSNVARGSRTPVLLVPGRSGPPDLSHEPRFARVLAPLDGSERAERALGPAVSLATLSDGECDLLHVVRSWPYAVNWSLAWGGPPVSAPWEPTREMRRYLCGVAGRLEARSVPTHWQVISDSRPAAEAIARYATQIGADVIALGTRGGSGLDALFHRNTAERVWRRAGVPVLICRVS